MNLHATFNHLTYEHTAEGSERIEVQHMYIGYQVRFTGFYYLVTPSTTPHPFNILHRAISLKTQNGHPNPSQVQPSKPAFPNVASICGTHPPWPKHKRMALDKPRRNVFCGRNHKETL